MSSSVSSSTAGVADETSRGLEIEHPQSAAMENQRGRSLPKSAAQVALAPDHEVMVTGGPAPIHPSTQSSESRANPVLIPRDQSRPPLNRKIKTATSALSFINRMRKSTATPVGNPMHSKKRLRSPSPSIAGTEQEDLQEKESSVANGNSNRAVSTPKPFVDAFSDVGVEWKHQDDLKKKELERKKEEWERKKEKWEAKREELKAKKEELKGEALKRQSEAQWLEKLNEEQQQKFVSVTGHFKTLLTGLLNQMDGSVANPMDFRNDLNSLYHELEGELYGSLFTHQVFNSNSDDDSDSHNTAVSDSELNKDFPDLNPENTKHDIDKLESELELHEVMGRLMSLGGLEKVKNFFFDTKTSVEALKRFRPPGTVNQMRFNAVFQGNPGTGKTTVARIYAEFLHKIGIIKSSHVIETSGAKLAFGGPAKIMLDVKSLLEEHHGGLLFIDEAYQLVSPHSGGGGKQALDIILTEIENHIGKLVAVFTGYPKEMELFFQHNPGLSQRIPLVVEFEDFNEWQLAKILCDLIKTHFGDGVKIDGNTPDKPYGLPYGLYIRIAIRRLYRLRHVRGFGNARAVQSLLAKIVERQARRLLPKHRQYQSIQPAQDGEYKRLERDYMELTQEDIIGPNPTEKLIEECIPWIKLQRGFIGLDKVKSTVKNLMYMIQANYYRELNEQQPIDFPLNRVFFGSPGTGKTSVAKLYGEILAHLGLLSRGDVVIKNPADFIGRALGHSEEKTKAILDMTIGQVLIIDEAYGLDPGGSDGNIDSFKAAVLDTIVAEIQGLPNEDRCILLLGYEDRLRTMFRNANPGLARRFALDEPFHFEDFNLEQLLQILHRKMVDQDLRATGEALEVARDMFERAKVRPDFSNAGDVDICLNRAKNNYLFRIRREKGVTYDGVLEAEDFDPDFQRSSKATSCRTYLENIVSEKIIKQLEDLQNMAYKARSFGLKLGGAGLPMCFIFKGPAGTGKSVTALNMGKVYYDMGLLATKEVIECSASDLVGEYVGQTGPKTKRQLEKALGKVLFVDDANRLKEGQYATEAVEEMVYLLSTPRFMGRMIVILAGRTVDMDELVVARSNLASFFHEEIVFEAMDAPDSIKLLRRELEDKHISTAILEDNQATGISFYTKAFRFFNGVRVLSSWGNAREIKILANRIARAVFKSLHPEEQIKEQPIDLQPEIALDCMRKLLETHYTRSNRPTDSKKDMAARLLAEAFVEESMGPRIVNDRKSNKDKSKNVGTTGPRVSGNRDGETKQNQTHSSLAMSVRPTDPVRHLQPDIDWRDTTPIITHFSTAPVVFETQLQTQERAGPRYYLGNDVDNDQETDSEEEMDEDIGALLGMLRPCAGGLPWIPEPPGYVCQGRICKMTAGEAKAFIREQRGKGLI